MSPDNHSTKTPRPVAQVPLHLGAIPKELKKHDRWILWRYSLIEKTGKWAKTPHSALSGHKVDATNFANGVDFITAVQALKAGKGRFDGLGFMLGAGIAGIDVDDCIDEDGNLDERGRKISDAYKGTYAEVSPSGQGFKILIDIGDDPKLAVIGKNTGDTEIYGGNRYFTVTGGVLPGHPSAIAPMAQAFADTAAAMGATRQKLADVPMERAKESIGLDLKGARELLDHLPFIWMDSYSEWIKSGMALHHEFHGDADALALWDEWSQRNPQKYDPGACELKWATFGAPGKDYTTMRTLVREAQAEGWRAPQTIERAIRDFSSLEEPHVTIEDDTGEISEPVSWLQKNKIGTYLAADPAPKEWVWRGLLRRGKVMLLAGAGGSSKSYLMLAASIQYTLGNDWGPFEISAGHTPGRVLLMYGEEDREDVHDRVHALRHAFMLTDEQMKRIDDRVIILPLRGEHVQLAKTERMTNEVTMTKHLERLETLIAKYDIKLVVLDPLVMFHAVEENDNVAITALMVGLDAMCMRQGCSMIIVHHFGKNGVAKASEVNEANVRGASSLVAHARTVAVLHRLRDYEAMEWGIHEEDHARWVMWGVVKNNYGPSGARCWFNVDQNTGALSPAVEQLVRLTVQSIRAQVQAIRDEDTTADIENSEFEKAKKQREKEMLLHGRVLAMLMEATKNGKLCKGVDAPTVLRVAGHKDITDSAARQVHTYIRNEGLVDTDLKVNHATEKWLDQHELLG